MTIVEQIAQELGIKSGQVSRTVELFDAGNTLPFVARYRKEMTGGLDEEQLRSVQSRLEYLRNLEQRKTAILSSIEEQGQLTDELKERILSAGVLQEVEDLYLPYKPKRRTRATQARERGLEPLAQHILDGDITQGVPLELAAAFIGDEVPDAETALAGARDIVAEVMSENADTRGLVRRALRVTGKLISTRIKDADAEAKYAMYYDYAEDVQHIPPHRLLALTRGEHEGALNVSLAADDEGILEDVTRKHSSGSRSIFAGALREAVVDGYARLLRPAMEREIRAEMLEVAERHAIQVFGANLRGLLLQAPIANSNVLALDPGFRTGCKVAVVDSTGKYLEHTTIYPHPPQNKRDEAMHILTRLARQHGVSIIAIGNGTASRETEAMVADMIAGGLDVSYVMVSEAGASVYSASKLAREEMPDLDVSIRGAVSIGRRLLDPLSELVKIEPRSIGVGLYQHDVNQKALAEALDDVVESAVNYVGVDVNTASSALLQYVAGINSRVAGAIVAHREANEPFQRRRDLLKVKGLGAKSYEQAVGFCRVREGSEPLDNTSIHPESYEACYALLARLGLKKGETIRSESISASWRALLDSGVKPAALVKELGIGLPTLEDMIKDLLKPGRDPREDMPRPILRTDVLTMHDLAEGMILMGTVRNVVDFGAFVDIGVKQDGLVHVSELADHFVQDPLDVVNVGDVVKVRVVSVDEKRGRIGLSMRL